MLKILFLLTHSRKTTFKNDNSTGQNIKSLIWNVKENIETDYGNVQLPSMIITWTEVTEL